MQVVGSILKAVAVLFVISLVPWHLAGGSPQGKCTVTCFCLLPIFCGSLSCIIFCAICQRLKAPRPFGLSTLTAEPRMDIPVLGAIAFGVACSCLLTPSLCEMVCRIYQVHMQISPCQVILPGLIFSTISAGFTFAYTAQSPVVESDSPIPSHFGAEETGIVSEESKRTLAKTH